MPHLRLGMQGLQAAASRLQQLFEEAQLPNGTSIWPPEAPDDGTSSPDVMGPASRNTSRDSLWGLDESRASDSIMGSGARNLPRMSPWNWSPRCAAPTAALRGRAQLTGGSRGARGAEALHM